MKVLKYINSILILVLVSCSSMHDYSKISYRTEIANIPVKIKMDIPKGYEELVLIRGSELEKQFWYKDSSVIYITASRVPLINYEHITATGKYGERQFLNDTMSLTGLDNRGFYWKDIKIKSGGSIGYANVSKPNKEKFEKALYSMVLK